MLNGKDVRNPVFCESCRNQFLYPSNRDRYPGRISEAHMEESPWQKLLTIRKLREKRFIFRNRHDAGKQLGAFLKTLPGIRNPLVLAIPAGGVPIGREVAAALAAPFSLAIVRKIRIPGTTESGFGAVTWDGQVLINERLRAALGLLPPGG